MELRHAMRLCWVVNPDAHQTLAAVVQAGLAGGVTMVQVRMPEASASLVRRATKQMVAWCTPYGVPVMVNDHVDVAALDGVAGVHLGQHDEDPARARLRMGAGKWIGLSVWTVEDARQAAQLAAGGAVNYASIGGVFASSTKQHTRPPQGLEGLRQAQQALRAQSDRLGVPPPPIMAISGIHEANVASVMRASVAGVAVSAGLWRGIEDTPSKVTARAQALRAIIEGTPNTQDATKEG